MRQGRVLIIESDPDRAVRLARLCERLGLQVRLSPDGLHAMMCALQDGPVRILVDDRDPRLGSLSLPETFRLDRRLSSIPLLVLHGEGKGRGPAPNRPEGTVA